MKFYTFILIFLFSLSELFSMELSTFSLKRDNLLIQIPKIWKWKHLTSEESKPRFKAGSRNGYYLFLIKKLSEDEEIEGFIDKNKLEIIDCDIKKENIQFIRLKQGDIYKYKRKSKIGYILSIIEKKNKYMVLFELKGSILESNKDLVIDILNGVRGIE